MYGRLRVDVLGPLRAWLGDTEIALGTARQRAAFAVLVGNAAEEVSYRELADAVWGAGAPATAQGNLHTYVSGLRRALGPARGLLVTTPRGYRLHLDGADVDSLSFERCRAEATRRLQIGDLEGAVDSLTLGLGLWKGEAYSAVPGPFAELEGQRLGESRIAAVEQRARILIEAGHQNEVVADAANLVRERPLRESARELLVLALHRCGRHAEALAAVEDARLTLARELGVSPGPALAELHARIRADASPQSGGPSAAAPRRAPGPVVPASVQETLAKPPLDLVGREDAVDRLRALAAGLVAGTGGAVWIEGDAGTGKSALLTAGLADAEAAGCTLGWAHADELLARFDLQVLMNCFDIDLAPGGRHAPGLDEDNVDDRVADLVLRTCAKAPFVLVVDDLHRADGATVRMWHRLVRATRDLPLLLVATSRPHGTRPDLHALRDAVRHADGHVVDLAPLTPAEAEHLVRETAGGCAAWTAVRLATQAAGNPLRLLELGRALRRRRVLSTRPGGAAPADTGPPQRGTASAAQRTLLSVSTASMRVVRAAAVLGAEFSESDLVVVTDLPAAAVREALDEAIAAQVVVEERGALAFRTTPLWRAAYERIPAPIRTPLRRQFTEMLAEATGPMGAERPGRPE
ncbi:BTAD domain-containing putative transcriptional regulator [Umezawaea sp. Da 62-37]|uniref:BTAD domain-containing putative transcriptional regulator n=1 Tax=Umezawaea sp. Da 62-37 TaxID=3075927 RepID=UPI0028F6E957|nr:BTAD domain-containing putative transcriptional regulator [Umezawaea sp. Da 62-37]WNV87315.1 BTAD domain-containing putative transcriptional regulator [Umezawaea sp. Da 62-37]